MAVRILLLTLMLSSPLFAQATADGSRPATSNVFNTQYPRVHPDGRATLRLAAPNSRKVQLAGALTPEPLDMIDDLIPTIDRTFRTRADRDHRAIAGLSMGSMQTMQIALRNLATFSRIGLFSGALVTGDLDTAYGGVFKDAAAFNRRVHLLWQGAGTAETALMERLDESHAMLEKRGIKHVIYKSQGTAHEWHTWRRHLSDFASRLF